MPEPRNPEPDVVPAPVRDGQLIHQPKLAGPSRIDIAAQWFLHHFGELGLTITFVVLAAAVSPWFLLGAGLVALLWTVHEYRVRRGNDSKEEQ